MTGRRYASLDAWRGVASLGVAIGHFWSIGLPAAIGVHLFFVISGYCIAAALHRAIAKGSSVREFARRRVRRIAPPYLASLVLAVLFLMALNTYNHGLAATGQGLAQTSPWFWVLNATLTQWLILADAARVGHPLREPQQNPVLAVPPYWSLCYEEQFYAVMGTVLALRSRVRPHHALALVTAVALVVALRWPGLITGFFIDYWLQFAAGALVYARLHLVARDDRRRAIDVLLVVAILALVGGAHAARTARLEPLDPALEMAVCLGYALLLILLFRFDGWFAGSLLGRVLRPLGDMSYSLYLTHWTVGSAIGSLRAGVLARAGVVAEVGVTLGIVLGFAFLFSRVFERPFTRAAVE